jgi:hypothetical protein
MTGIPDELVEKAVDALLDETNHNGLDCGPAPDPLGIVVQVVLTAVGLPALLERVEAAEADHSACVPVSAWVDEVDELTGERDAARAALVGANADVWDEAVEALAWAMDNGLGWMPR